MRFQLHIVLNIVLILHDSVYNNHMSDLCLVGEGKNFPLTLTTN
jgi:hypothetical protein